MDAAHLETLQQKLNDSTPEKRTKLLNFVSDICRQSGSSLPEQHMQMLVNFAETLIDNIDLYTLCESAEIFAHLKTAPHSLIYKLAHQKIEVAATIIENSVVLTDDDLIEIIQEKDAAYQRHIVQRETLSKHVTDCLIEKVDPQALEALVKNKGASFSDNSFTKLTEIGIQNETIAEILVVRPDMPQEIAIHLLEKLDLMGSGKLMEKGEKLRIKFGSEALNAHKMRSQRELFLPEAKTYIDQIGRGEKTLDNSIIELCTKGDEQPLCQVIAASAQIAESVVTAAFFNVSGAHIMQFSKQLQLSREAFLAIATLRTRRGNLPNSQIFYLMRQFDALSD